MKAAQIHEYGDASVVQVGNVEKPVPKQGQVVVEVHAASLNPFDTKLRSGVMQQIIPLHFPATLGGDIAGIVTEVGADVTSIAVGDHVYGQAAAVAGNSGAFAEFASTAADQIAGMPTGLTFQEAAALPLVGVSAWQALTQHIKLEPGQKILITGGAGGIGSIAIQIAKHLGAHVTATATGEGIELVRMLGADKALDYKSQALAEIAQDFDTVFDTVGGEGLHELLDRLKPGGVAVTMVGQFDEAYAQQRNVTAIYQMTRVTSSALTSLRKLVEAGVVTPRIGKVFALDAIQEAFAARESGHGHGKVVLAITQD